MRKCHHKFGRKRPDWAQRARIGTRGHSRVRDRSSSSRQHLSLLLGLQLIAAVRRIVVAYAAAAAAKI